CEQTSKQGSLDSMIQTTTSKLVFTITETLPTSSIQAIAEKYETILTYASQCFSSYEQAKQQYPTSMPEYKFTFDDANLTITMVASKESLNEISARYSTITYEQFVSSYLTFGDTIENVTNSEKTILKSINNPDSNIKIETIFVKIADDNSGNSGTGNSGNTGDSGDESGETIVDTNDPFYGLTSFTMENDESTYLVDSENKTITKISDTPLFVYTYDYKIEDDKTILTLSFEKIKSIIDDSKLVTVDECIEELNSMQLEEAQLNYYLFSLRNPKKYSLVINERADTSANVTIEGYYDSSVKWYDQISGRFICQYDNMDYESVTRTTLQGYLSKAVKEFIYTYQTADNTTQIIYTTISIDDSKIIIKSVDDDNVSKTIPYTKSESSNNAVITIDFGDFTTDLTWEGSTYLGL
ncbi:MAG: hypothetical protein UH788_00475, partial [Treponemataceae bacterium]|nr:hypothetical protein [Treponemataceae bacterium]